MMSSSDRRAIAEMIGWNDPHELFKVVCGVCQRHNFRPDVVGWVDVDFDIEFPGGWVFFVAEKRIGVTEARKNQTGSFPEAVFGRYAPARSLSELDLVRVRCPERRHFLKVLNAVDFRRLIDKARQLGSDVVLPE